MKSMKANQVDRFESGSISKNSSKQCVPLQVQTVHVSNCQTLPPFRYFFLSRFLPFSLEHLIFLTFAPPWVAQCAFSLPWFLGFETKNQLAISKGWQFCHFLYHFWTLFCWWSQWNMSHVMNQKPVKYHMDCDLARQHTQGWVPSKKTTSWGAKMVCEGLWKRLQNGEWICFSTKPCSILACSLIKMNMM